MSQLTQNMYRIIDRDSYGNEFTHGPDIKSYAEAVKELEAYRLWAADWGVNKDFILVEVTCKDLSV